MSTLTPSIFFLALPFKLKAASRLAIGTAMAFCLCAARAQNQPEHCWDNAQLTQLTAQLAQRHFPALLQKMPSIVECSDGSFARHVGGDYTTGLARIRIPSSTKHSANLQGTILHELAHAMVDFSGQYSNEYNGHDQTFYKALLAAGLGHEASRVANIYGNHHDLIAAGGQATADPMAMAPPRPVAYAPPPVFYKAAPVRWVQQCRDFPVWQPVWNGRFMQLAVVATQRQCQNIAIQPSHR